MIHRLAYLLCIVFVGLSCGCTLVRYTKLGLESKGVELVETYQLPVDEGIVYETFERLAGILGLDPDQLDVLYLGPLKGVPNTWTVIYEDRMLGTPFVMQIVFAPNVAEGVITPIK